MICRHCGYIHANPDTKCPLMPTDELTTLRARVGELEAQLAEGVRHVRALIDPYALRSRLAAIERAEAWAGELSPDPALTSTKGG